MNSHLVCFGWTKSIFPTALRVYAAVIYQSNIVFLGNYERWKHYHANELRFVRWYKNDTFYLILKVTGNDIRTVSNMTEYIYCELRTWDGAQSWFYYNNVCKWNRWLINPLPLPPTYENKLQPYRLTNFSIPSKFSTLNFHLSLNGFIFFLSRVWFYEQINVVYIIQKHRKPTRDARSRHIISHVCSARGSLTAARISSSMRL